MAGAVGGETSGVEGVVWRVLAGVGVGQVGGEDGGGEARGVEGVVWRVFAGVGDGLVPGRGDAGGEMSGVEGVVGWVLAGVATGDWTLSRFGACVESTTTSGTDSGWVSSSSADGSSSCAAHKHGRELLGRHASGCV